MSEFEVVHDALDMLWGFNRTRRIRAEAALDRIEAEIERLTAALEATQEELRLQDIAQEQLRG